MCILIWMSPSLFVVLNVYNVVQIFDMQDVI